MGRVEVGLLSAYRNCPVRRIPCELVEAMMLDDGVEPDPWEDEGAPFNAVGPGGVRVLAQPCRTCIFRADSVISCGRVEEMVQTACQRDSAIICHATLDLAEQAVCRGFYARHAGDTAPLRLAAWLGAVDEVPPPAK